MTTEQEQAIEVISKMETLLATPARWTQGDAAKNECGETVLFNDPSAACWCLAGAKAMACTELGYGGDLVARFALDIASGDGDYLEWNDAPERTHSEVIEILAKAKALIASGEVK